MRVLGRAWRFLNGALGTAWTNRRRVLHRRAALRRSSGFRTVSSRIRLQCRRSRMLGVTSGGHSSITVGFTRGLCRQRARRAHSSPGSSRIKSGPTGRPGHKVTEGMSGDICSRHCLKPRHPTVAPSRPRRHGDPFPVRAPRGALHLAGVPGERIADGLAGVGVPQPDGLVLAGASQPVSVWAESYDADRTGVPVRGSPTG